MNRSADLIRTLVLALSGLALAACVPIRAPEFGPGPPPMLSPKQAKTLGPAR